MSKNVCLTAGLKVLFVLMAAMLCISLSGCSGTDVEDTAIEESGLYNDGVYEGKALGYNANISVLVTVEDDVITDVTVMSHNEDDPYWDNAQRVIDEITASGKAEVDTVSGATYSSQGIIDAVEDALNKAVK